MNVYLKKKNNSWQKLAIGVGALILFILVLNIFQSPIKNTFYLVTSPVQKIFWQAGDSASGFFGALFNGGGLTQENNNLKEENQILLSQISSLQETIKGDRAIQEVVANTQSDDFKLLLAGAIGTDGDTMLINRGSTEGIRENMPVISSQKVLFGKVVKVYSNFSQVMLISSKQSVVDAKIQNLDITKPPVFGVVKGTGNHSLYLDLVATDVKISLQDTLITSGQEGIFPKDLLIGKITKNNQSDSKPFQTAQVEPLFDINNADNLFVITNYKR